MGLFDIFKRKKKDDLPFIAKVNIAEMMKKREEERKNNPPEVSILASADFTERHREKIRLNYVSLERFNRYGGGKRIGKTIGYTCPFKAPKGMDFKDVCKVISFLSELVEKDETIKPASEASVQIVGTYLKRLGFDKLNENEVEYSHRHAVSFDTKEALNLVDTKIVPQQQIGITDLFTVGGDLNLFSQSDLMNYYFDWFTPNVTEQEVRDIYASINQELDAEFSIEEICRFGKKSNKTQDQIDKQ